MPKILSDQQVKSFRERGFLYPFPCLSSDRAAWMCDDLERFESEQGTSAGKLQMKGHLCFRWSYDLSFEDAILDVVEDLIGPDILCFASRFWMKSPGDGAYVPWHQDSAYFGLDQHDLVAVWVALTDSAPAHGCVRVIPGSHHWPAQTHTETPDKKTFWRAANGSMESTNVKLSI